MVQHTTKPSSSTFLFYIFKVREYSVTAQHHISLRWYYFCSDSYCLCSEVTLADVTGQELRH